MTVDRKNDLAKTEIAFVVPTSGGSLKSFMIAFGELNRELIASHPDEAVQYLGNLPKRTRDGNVGTSEARAYLVKYGFVSKGYRYGGGKTVASTQVVETPKEPAIRAAGFMPLLPKEEPKESPKTPSKK